MLDRRTILRGTFASAAITPLGFAGQAAAAAASGLSVRDLPGGLALVTGAGANVVVASGPEGAVVVDSGQASSAGALLALATQRAGGRKPATLINTCWRPEQTGGNDVFGAGGVRILAHENTRLWMSSEIASRFDNKVFPPRAPAARPTATVFKTGSMPLGEERIDYGHLRAPHTDGDLYVFFRKANVVAVGAAFASQGWPVLDWETGGWMGGHIWALEILGQLTDDKTTIVTAAGPHLTRADLAKQREMYLAIMTKMQTMMEAGTGLKEVVASKPAAEYEAERGNSDLFVAQAFRGFLSNIRQFRAI